VVLLLRDVGKVELGFLSVFTAEEVLEAISILAATSRATIAARAEHGVAAGRLQVLFALIADAKTTVVAVLAIGRALVTLLRFH
jgi:hypothetical protein